MRVDLLGEDKYLYGVLMWKTVIYQFCAFADWLVMLSMESDIIISHNNDKILRFKMLQSCTESLCIEKLRLN